MDALRVLTLADDAYSLPLAVLGLSLFEHHRPDRPLRLTVVDGGIAAENRRRLQDSWAEAAHRCGGEWEFVPPSYGGMSALPLWGRIPRLTYARLALADYFPGTGGKIVQLDSDTMVLTGLAPLLSIDLGDAVLAATRDPFVPVVSAVHGLAVWRELGLGAQTPYFNAGVMVIDLDRWRQRRVTPRTFDFIRRQVHRLRLYDQDSLNGVLHSQWKEIDARWQVQPRTPHALGVPIPRDPGVVHFSGRLKPWDYRAGGVLDRVFYDYVNKTAWRGFQPPRNWKARFLEMYDTPLRRAVHPLETRLSAWARGVEQWRRRDSHSSAAD